MRINKKAIENIDEIIRTMMERARNDGAEVFQAEALTAGDPLRILIFTMLSARTKDETTMKALQRLYAKADTREKIASMKVKELEKILYGIGFYRVKARNLLKMMKMIRHVPDDLQELLKLPGVGRKTANIVLARAFGRKTVGVDVHVHRISNRLGIVKTKKPEQTETALTKIILPETIGRLNLAFVAYGQTVCLPRKPLCSGCQIASICFKKGVEV